MASYTITGSGHLPDDTTPLPGAWYISLASQYALDPGRGFRASFQRVTPSPADPSMVSVTLPETVGDDYYVAYFQSADRSVRLPASGFYTFTLTADTTWDTIITTPTVPPMTPTLVAQAEAAATAAGVSETNAATSATEAAASAQQAHDISNIDTSDDVISTVLADDTSEARGVLNGLFAPGGSAGNVGVAAVGAARPRIATRAAYDGQRSAAFAQVATASATTFTETWAGLAAWAVTSASVQVSAGKLYGVTGGGGANHAWRVAPGATSRVVIKVDLLTGGTSGQGVFVGWCRDGVGAAPVAGAAHSRGLYFKPADGTIVSLDDGVQTSVLYTGLGSSTWYVTVIADENYTSISAIAASGGSPRVYTRWARDDAAHPINNLSLMINDSRGLAGSSVEAITEASIGGIVAPTLVTGSTPTGGVGVHWASMNGDNFLVMTPAGYDSRKGAPAAILFHGHGSDETHWTTNANGKAVADQFLANGYVVIAAANTGSTSTWGGNAGLNAYINAWRYARDHYHLTGLVAYANSMGSIESLVTLSQDTIPGIAAWAGTSPTYSLLDNFDNAAQPFTASIISAYGITASTLTAATNVGDTAVSSAVSYPAGTDLLIDYANATPGSYEHAQVQAVTGAGPYTLTLTAPLTKAHAAGCTISDYPDKTAGHDPASLSPLLLRGVPMWILYATDDTTVDPTANGAALAANVADTDAITITTTTGGHSTPTIATDASAIVSFFNGVLGLVNSYPA